MKNQIQTAIELRDRATQVALNFVGHRISSSDGSYSLLIDCIQDALNQTFVDGANSVPQVAVTAEAEREACAKIAEERELRDGSMAKEAKDDGKELSQVGHTFGAMTAAEIKRKIRARSEK